MIIQDNICTQRVTAFLYQIHPRANFLHRSDFGDLFGDPLRHRVAATSSGKVYLTPTEMHTISILGLTLLIRWTYSILVVEIPVQFYIVLQVRELWEGISPS